MLFVILLIFISKFHQKISLSVEQQVMFAADQIAFRIKTLSLVYD